MSDEKKVKRVLRAGRRMTLDKKRYSGGDTVKLTPHQVIAYAGSLEKEKESKPAPTAAPPQADS